MRRRRRVSRQDEARELKDGKSYIAYSQRWVSTYLQFLASHASFEPTLSIIINGFKTPQCDNTAPRQHRRVVARCWQRDACATSKPTLKSRASYVCNPPFPHRPTTTTAATLSLHNTHFLAFPTPPHHTSSPSHSFHLSLTWSHLQIAYTLPTDWLASQIPPDNQASESERVDFWTQGGLKVTFHHSPTSPLPIQTFFVARWGCCAF